MPKDMSILEQDLKRKPTKPAKPPAGKRKKKDITEYVVVEEKPAQAAVTMPPTTALPPPFIPDARTEKNEPMIIDKFIDVLDTVKMDQSTQTPLMTCPIHFAELKEKVNQKGDFHYLKCSVDNCCLFTSKEDAERYMRIVQLELHDDIKQAWRNAPLKCRCKALLNLKVSASAKNSNRLYLACQRNQCGYFQWGDIPLTEKNKTLHFDNSMEEIVKEAFERCVPFNKPRTFEEIVADPEFLTVLPDSVIQALQKNLTLFTTQPRGYYIEGSNFYDDGTYPGKIMMADDGRNTIGYPPELAGLSYTPTPEKKAADKQRLLEYRDNMKKRHPHCYADSPNVVHASTSSEVQQIFPNTYSADGVKQGQVGFTSTFGLQPGQPIPPIQGNHCTLGGPRQTQDVSSRSLF